MAQDRIVRFIITGDSAGAVRAMKSTEVAASRTERQIDRTGSTAKAAGRKAEEGGRGFHKLGGAISGITGLGKLGLGVAGLGGLAFGIKDVVSAGQRWQDQQAQLKNALRATGNVGKDSLGKINEAIDKLALHGGFAPPEQIQSLTQLLRATGDVAKAIRDEALATNIARGTHKDFLVVSKAVALAEQGRTTGLSRLGIVLGKHITATEALAKLQRLYGGSTAAYAKTSQGAITSLHNALDILNQRLGAALLPTITKVVRALSEGLSKVIKFLDTHKTQVHAFLKAVGEAFSTMWHTVRPILGAFVSGISSAVKWLGKHKDIANALMKVLGILAGTIATVFVAGKIAAFGGAVVRALGLATGAVEGMTAANRLAGIGFGTLIPIIGAAAAAYLTLHKNIVLAAGSSPQQVASALNKQGGGFATQTIVSQLKNKGAFNKPKANVYVPPKHYALGGAVGGSGFRDSVPAMLTPGEFVLKPSVVNSLGVGNLNAVNNAGHLAAGAMGPHEVVIPVRLTVGERVLAEAVARHTLKKGARR